MFTKVKLLALKSLFFFGLTLVSSAAPTISNVADWDGSTEVSSFGTGATKTYGQVFTPTGPDTILNSFSMQLGYRTFQTVSFRAYVQEFDEGTDSSVGNILFTSSVLSSSIGAGFETITINTGSLQLAANTSYVAYFSAAAEPETGTLVTMAFITSPPANPNLGGFRFSNTENFSSLTGPENPWGTLTSVGGQLVFDAQFSASASSVPEIDATSAGVPLAIAGICFLILTDRRKRLSVLS